MAATCCVYTCTQKGYCRKDGSRVSFHRFPREASLRRQWTDAITFGAGEPVTVTHTSRVCSKHFHESDFLTNIVSGRRILVDGVVPTIFTDDALSEDDESDDHSEEVNSVHVPKLKDILQCGSVAHQAICQHICCFHEQTECEGLQQLRQIQAELEATKHRLSQAEKLLTFKEDELTRKMEECSLLVSKAENKTDKNAPKFVVGIGRHSLRERKTTAGQSQPENVSDHRQKNKRRVRESTPEIADVPLPIRKYRTTKVKGKSARHEGESNEQYAKRLAKYAQKYQRFKELDTLEKRQIRLKRDRERRRIRNGDKAMDVRRKQLPKTTSRIMEPQELEKLQRDYAKFQEYVYQMVPRKYSNHRYLKSKYIRSMETKDRTEQEPQKKSDELPVGNKFEQEVRAAAERRNLNLPKTIYSDNLVDPEIALLEISEDKFVPVQVINQTIDEFDDMLEIETV